MAHGGYDKRRVAGRKPGNKTTGSNNRTKSLGVDKKPKAKLISLKRQIRSTDRLLRKDTRPEVKEALEKKLEGLKSQQRTLDNQALERKLSLRYRKIKFFERRKVERNIRRLEKQQRTSSGQAQEAELAEQLSKLKEDLEYIRFFPKTEKYIALFKKGENTETIDKRNSLRTKIKENIAAAVASGKDLEETGSDDDGVELSDDDFFANSSDEADADDEETDDKSAREQASSASGKAASGMSSDERNQRHISARALMPPPRASEGPNANHVKSRYNNSFQKNSYSRRADMSSSSNTSTSFERPSYKNRKPLVSHTHTGNTSANRRPLESGTHTGNSGSNLSSNSDARKPKRKRRPKKKKQQG